MPMNERTIYALGFFDGVHLAHQALLTACRQLAQRTGAHPGVVTFLSHPQTLTAGKAPGLINTPDDRARLLLSFGITQLQFLNFDEDLRSRPWQAFLEELLGKDAAGFVCGDDFRFGYRGEGNANLLADFCRERDLPYTIVPGQTLEGTRISSTHIRALLQQGDLESANRFLGHDHMLTGPVVRGHQLGRTMGVPTANLRLPEEVICPRHGVYACSALVDGQLYTAVTNIGTRPTVEGHHVTVEAWLLDFQGDLYGREITLFFHKFLRPEEKFDSLASLKAQIQKDAQAAKELRIEN